MRIPYKEKTKVTYPYGIKGHRGIDLSAAHDIGDMTIVSVVSGKVVYAGWENPNNHTQGYGQVVVIRDSQNLYWIHAHLSQILAKYDQIINVGDTIGIEGNTGNSFGSHLHFEVRQGGWAQSNVSLNIPSILGISNVEGTILTKSETVVEKPVVKPVTSTPSTGNKFSYTYSDKILELQKILNRKNNVLVEDGIFGEKTLTEVKKYTIEFRDRGNLTKWTQERLTQLGFNSGFPDGYAEEPTMNAIYNFQKANNLGTTTKKGYTYLGGDDWYYLCK